MGTRGESTRAMRETCGDQRGINQGHEGDMWGPKEQGHGEACVELI